MIVNYADFLKSKDVVPSLGVDSDRVQICLLDESGVGYMVKIEATTTGSADQYPSATVTLSPLATCWLVLDS